MFYDYTGKGIKIFTGQGSAKVFRCNFFQRLAEVFCNLKWSYPQLSNSADIDKFMKEYNLYKKIYFDMMEFYGAENLNFLKSFFDQLEEVVNRK